MDHAVRRHHPAIQAIVDFAELQELQVRKLDRLQRLLTFPVHKHRRSPVCHEQIVASITNVLPQCFRNFIRKQRLSIQSHQPREPVRGFRQDRLDRQLVGRELKHEVLFGHPAPYWVVNGRQQLIIQGSQHRDGRLSQRFRFGQTGRQLAEIARREHEGEA